MEKVNTYGLKMVGLKKACGETVDWGRSGWKTQISYDQETGEIFTNDHLGECWSEYHDPDIITVCTTTHHMTMQAIADAIREAVRMKEVMEHNRRQMR